MARPVSAVGRVSQSDVQGGPARCPTDFRSTVVKPFLREAVQLTEGQPTEAQLPSVELRRAFQPDSPEKDGITSTQKGQADKLALIDIADPDFAREYVQQRARGAYISPTCQPEAAFDLSIAAQHSKEPTPTVAKSPCRRIHDCSMATVWYT